MKKFTLRHCGLALLAGGLMSAQAATAAPVIYVCQFDNQSYWNWIPDAAAIMVDEVAGVVASDNSHFSTSGGEGYEGRLRGSNRRLMATFQTDEALTSSGRKINVRYTWRMNRSDLGSTLSVQVGQHGQQHRSDGQCQIKS